MAHRKKCGNGIKKGGMQSMNNDVRKLMRSRGNKMICGVCGGIGEYLNIDPTLVRLIWAICSVASVGMGLLVYFVAVDAV